MPEANIGQPITCAPVDRLELATSSVRGGVQSSTGGQGGSYFCFSDNEASPAIVKAVIGCSCFDLD